MTGSRFRRVILVVLDGVGVGALPDAATYGDAAANTLGHVAAAVGGINLPNLQKLGLGNILPAQGLEPALQPIGAWGKMAERSVGKDTTTGHWELAGLVTTEPFASYPDGFPPGIIELFVQQTGLVPLGNIAASGTDIIRDLGEEHLRSGRPIVYTSVDSVFQIAAHEEVIPPTELYAICRKMRKALDPYRIGRIIARPFIGTAADNFSRTHRRHDFAMPPHGETILDLLFAAGQPVVAIGKISDIFAGRGVTSSVSTIDNSDGMRQLCTSVADGGHGLLFVNLVDFDMLYGHRLDAEGFAGGLQDFDRFLTELTEVMDAEDLLLITADHGCDPTTPGTDHSREYVPLLAWHRRMERPAPLGVRQSFADVAATVAEALGAHWPVGESFSRLL